MLKSLTKGVLVALAVSLSSLSCAGDSPLAVEQRTIISGTVESVEVHAEAMRVQVLLRRDGSRPEFVQVFVVGRALGGQDITLLRTLAGVADGSIAPGKTVRFQAYGEIRVGAPIYYASHLLR